MPSKIEDYALLGDLQTCALVAKNGSIDWLCVPRFDSPACFAALLGSPEHGRWMIAPVEEPASVRRRYQGETLILETEFETATGRARLIDFMPPRTDVVDIVRIVEGIEGEVEMRMDLVIRFDYGWVVPWVRDSGSGITAVAGPDTLHLTAPVDLEGENQHTVAHFRVRAGDRLPFDLTWHPTYGAGPGPKNAFDSLASTEAFWREWVGKCAYQGPWRDAVVRSLITLKAMTYAPTGGLVAAATTSLPEKIGGVRNWDYRYCWLRDATFTLYALMIGGYTSEAHAWREWLVNSVAGNPAELQIMYGLGGERRLTELEIGWLPGYEGSTPVRVGNEAYRQFQLDVFGEVMDALHLARRTGLLPDENSWRVQRAMMDFLDSAWREPDEGIWEVRGPRRHFVHSKVMAWVAYDRAVAAVEEFGLDGPVQAWRETRQAIHDQVCREGFDSELGAFVQYYGSKDPDASLLMLAPVGFLPWDDPRIVGTVDLIRDRLQDEHGFVDRYPTARGIDGLPPGEGSFLLCSFWMVDNLALQGKWDEARELFTRLLDLRNDVGLLSEEYDPVRSRMLGNFPQAFSHTGLINTARNLERRGGPAEDRRRHERLQASRERRNRDLL
ncbi:MAG: glycoside hydrolase family 15 protein [Thermoanaerobaculia bacterium]